MSAWVAFCLSKAYHLTGRSQTGSRHSVPMKSVCTVESSHIRARDGLISLDCNSLTGWGWIDGYVDDAERDPFKEIIPRYICVGDTEPALAMSNVLFDRIGIVVARWFSCAPQVPGKRTPNSLNDKDTRISLLVNSAKLVGPGENHFA